MRSSVRAILRWTFFALAALLLVVVACAVFVAPSVWRAAGDGRTALLEASKAVVRKDAAVARAEFEGARKLFATALQRLDSAWTLPLRLLPVASTHVHVSRGLARIGSTVADAGIAIADSMDELPDQQLTFEKGRVDLDLVRTAARALTSGVPSVSVIEDAIAEMPAGWVGGPLSEPRRQVLTLLPGVIDGVRKAEAALAGLPGLLAEGGRKRYLVAFSNLSELRGSGGLFGYVTALEAAEGDLDLDELSGRPTEIFPAPGKVGLDFPAWFPSDLRAQAAHFQNINMTSDFPTVGSFVMKTAEAEGGEFDGVIAVDPIGISAILGLTGAVRVPTWEEEIDADNVAKIAMHDVYIAIPTDNDRRERFFEQLVRAAFERLVSTRITLTPQAVGVFDRAVKGGHFRMFSEHAVDQAVIERIGAGGNVRRTADATDVLSVISENAAGSKADWFLRREIRYRVRLDPDHGSADTAVGVLMRNQAPKMGLPDYIIGSPLSDLETGSNRQIVMLVRSLEDDLGEFIVSRSDISPSPAAEGPLRVYRTTVDIASGSQIEIGATSHVRRAVRRSGDVFMYRLRVLRQAIAHPDFADIEIEVPKGWQASGQTTFLGDLNEDVSLEVRLERTARGTLVERLVRGPWDAVRGALGRLF